MPNNVHDMIIIGSGPAGLGTALYAQRAGLDVLILEMAPMSGGQIVNTTEVDNYLGLPGIGGFEMGDTFRRHVEGLGAVFVEDEAVKVETDGDIRIVTGRKDTYSSYTVVFAMGAVHSVLGVKGETELTGHGVSYCATCDGAFFRGKDTIVVGGGDVAVGDAIYLAGLCSHVTLIHRRDELRAAKSIQDAFFSHENAEVMWDSVLESIEGTDRATGVKVRNVKTGEITDVPAAGVFIAVGMKPVSALAGEICELDASGYIRAGEDCVTSCPGVYAVGDIRTKNVRQVITAVADGACAVSSAEKYLRNIK